jgi:hypothetical protein
VSWLEFISAGLLFLLTHRVPTIPLVRAKIVSAIGERGFLITYSALSIIVLTWLIIAAGRAPYIEVWATAPWQYWLPNIAMPIVCILIGFSVAAPNPLSFGGSKPEAFDPDHPGFAGVTRHGCYGRWRCGPAVICSRMAILRMSFYLAVFAHFHFWACGSLIVGDNDKWEWTRGKPWPARHQAGRFNHSSPVAGSRRSRMRCRAQSSGW